MFYTAGQNLGKLNGIKWHYFKGPSYSLHSTTMMIRPLEFWRYSVRSNCKNKKRNLETLPDAKLLENLWSKTIFSPFQQKKWQLREITKVLDCGFGAFWVHKSLCLGLPSSRGLTIAAATYYQAFKREETAQLSALQTTTGSYFGTMVARW